MVNSNSTKTMNTHWNQESWTTITLKNIVKDSLVQIITSVAMVTFVPPRNTVIPSLREKKTFAIASLQPFDHCSSLSTNLYWPSTIKYQPLVGNQYHYIIHHLTTHSSANWIFSLFLRFDESRTKYLYWFFVLSLSSILLREPVRYYLFFPLRGYAPPPPVPPWWKIFLLNKA